jgi:thiosulfate/3-mercaptopyruvate sulfurtransferase
MANSLTPLVSTQWLAEHLDAPDIRVVDASWYMPAQARDATQEYVDGHIPGAIQFDIDEISDTDSPFPHMLPPPEKFSSRMKRLGIGDGHHVVAYDGAGIFSSARVWWMFKAMGHENVSVLNGGLKKWNEENRPLENKQPKYGQRHYTARLNNFIVRDISDMQRNLETQREQVIDARARGRFDGTAPEPRPELQSGHMPNSISVPFDQLINNDGTLKEESDLRAIFEGAGIDLTRPIITTCGSGVTAAILSLALTTIGHNAVALYDGSWSEWAATEGAIIVTNK